MPWCFLRSLLCGYVQSPGKQTPASTEVSLLLAKFCVRITSGSGAGTRGWRREGSCFLLLQGQLSLVRSAHCRPGCTTSQGRATSPAECQCPGSERRHTGSFLCEGNNLSPVSSAAPRPVAAPTAASETPFHPVSPTVTNSASMFQFRSVFQGPKLASFLSLDWTL